MDQFGALPGLKVIWGFAVIVPLLIGTVVTLGAGGAALWKRIAGAALCAQPSGYSARLFPGWLGANDQIEISVIAINCLWRAFVFTIVSVLGVLLTEVNMPEPQ